LYSKKDKTGRVKKPHSTLLSYDYILLVTLYRTVTKTPVKISGDGSE